MSAYFHYHSSFTCYFSTEKDGITRDQANTIEALIKAQNLKGILIYCTEYKVIRYGLLDSDGAELDYFFSPQDLIEYLEK